MKYLFPDKKIEDISGMKSGFLTATKFSHISENGTAAWDSVCECGNTKKVRASSIKKRGTKTCGKCHLWKHLITRRFYE